MRVTAKIIEDRLKELVVYQNDKGSIKNVIVTHNRENREWCITVVFTGEILISDINIVDNSYIKKNIRRIQNKY